jgi:hypothetical protein
MAPLRMVSPVCGRHWRPGDQQPPGPSSCWLHLIGRPWGLAWSRQPPSFVEPAVLGRPAASFSPEVAAPGSGGGT